MNEVTRLGNEITNWIDTFKANHEEFIERGNKAAGTRARKALGEVKKLTTAYRQASVAAAQGM